METVTVKKKCAYPCCSGTAIAPNRYCEKHAEHNNKWQEYKRTHGSKWKETPYSHLYHSGQWRKLRAEVLQAEPVCQRCRAADATEVHHIVPHKGNEELFYNRGNLLSVCHRCHVDLSAELAAEQKRINERNKQKLWY